MQPWASCRHTCASVTKQYNLVPANGHLSQTLVVLHLRTQGLEEGDEHPHAKCKCNLCSFFHFPLLIVNKIKMFIRQVAPPAVGLTSNVMLFRPCDHVTLTFQTLIGVTSYLCHGLPSCHLSACNALPSRLMVWRFGVAVMRWSRSTQLLYIEPG